MFVRHLINSLDLIAYLFDKQVVSTFSSISSIQDVLSPLVLKALGKLFPFVIIY